MIKICPTCRRTFSGGTVCLSCVSPVALLDVADQAVRRAYLRSDGELRVTIRTYYGARSAMLILFIAMLFSAALSLALVRRAFGSPALTRMALLATAAAIGVGLPIASAFFGAKLVHRFSSSCHRRPLRASDLRIVRRREQA